MSRPAVNHCDLRRRRGFTVFELAIAVVLLAVAMSVTVKLLGAIAQERRAVGHREVAAREVANLMEHLSARSWDDLTAAAANDVRLSEPARQALPGAELNVAVDEETEGGTPAKRVAIRLRWRNRAGEFDAPVRLVTWIFARPARRTAK